MVELLEVSERCISVETVTDDFYLSLLPHWPLFKHFCLFLHLYLTSQIWMRLAIFLFAIVSPLNICQPMLPGFPCSPGLSGWWFSVMNLLYEVACELAALTPHPYLTCHTWRDIGVMRGFLHPSMVAALGTPCQIDCTICVTLLCTEVHGTCSEVKKTSLSSSYIVQIPAGWCNVDLIDLIMHCYLHVRISDLVFHLL